MRATACSVSLVNGGAHARAAAFALLLLLGAGVGSASGADSKVHLGLGAYDTAPRSGFFSHEPLPPQALYRTGPALHRAAPTNQWYSSVMFTSKPYPIYAQPLSYRASSAGFEVGLPDRHVESPDPGRRQVVYRHVAAILVSPAGFKPGPARLSDFSDWLAKITWTGGAGQTMSATVLHGNPFSYYDCSSGDVDFKIMGSPTVIADPRDHTHDPRMAAFSVAGHSYAVFAPTGSTWDWSQPDELVLHLPADKRYFSVAGLPDDRQRTLKAFLAVAYAFPTKTRAVFHYDERTSQVRTTFRVDTVAKEGTDTLGFMGLYPHQWDSVTPRPKVLYTYDSVRGPIRVIKANSFVLEHTYHAFVPYWPRLEVAAHRREVNDLLVGDVAKSGKLFEHGFGTYWIGKGLGAAAQLMMVAKAEGKTSEQKKLLKLIEGRIESWFNDRHATHFRQDSTIGTFVGLPQEFGSVSHMNDHHFHYGYWLMASAYVAMNDPAWAAPSAWGGMVNKLVADIATEQHGRADFPYLRNFDAYEGHSWASGDAAMYAGNNQESSSEAVNAWAGLILWGEATHNTKLRNLGIYLYTSEIASIHTYWFDLKHQVLGADFGHSFASMVFGDKYAYNTWWTEEPREILGINMMPITPASIYLGADPAYDRALMAQLPKDEAAYAKHGVSDGTPADIWQDVLASFLALSDPQAGFKSWHKDGTVEAGETRTHTLFWLYSLEEMGPPDLSVTADTPLYSVFKNAAGVRTYLAYNGKSTPIRVTFSTGKVMVVPANSLARSK